MLTSSLTLKNRHQRTLSLTALSLSYFMLLLDSTILNVALPSIEKQLHGSVASLQWVVNSYTLVFASFLLSSGSIGDRYGVRRTFRLGLAIFTLASFLCSLSPTIEILVTARVIQGLGAALMVPASLSLIAHLFTEPQEQAKAVAIWAGIGSIAVAFGPTLGGLLVEFLGWRSVFLINIPFGILALLLTLFNLPATPERQESSLDLPGQALAILACCTLTYGLIEWGHVAPTELMMAFVIAIISGAAFIAVERRRAHPMLPLSLFRSWRVSATMLVGLVYQFSFYSLIFVFSLFFQQFYGYRALEAGLAFMPQTILGSAAILFATRWIMRWLRPRTSLAIGMLLGAVGMLVIFIGIHMGFLLIAVGEALVGVTASFIVTPMTTVILASVGKEQSGIASACLNAARQMGGVLGVALLGTVLGSQALFVGTEEALFIMSGGFLLGFVLILSSTNQPRRAG
jgi:DHA2 family methylenomycin A resistance protein-like MFS transporter